MAAPVSLAPPTNLAAKYASNVALIWAPSANGWASGYELFRSATSGAGYASPKTVTPGSASATTDDPANGTWFYVLRATFQNWSSVRTNKAAVIVAKPSATTPVTQCIAAGSAAETTNAGDNDGDEGNPSRACAEQVVLTSNTLITYTMGGATDTWGRSWTVANLGAGPGPRYRQLLEAVQGLRARRPGHHGDVHALTAPRTATLGA